MRIDYVIVAYRSESHLEGCLEAIDADRPPGAGVIVVDNASPDASSEIAAGHRSGPAVIRMAKNDGFGAGCNAGAEASTADVVFFVNPDARLRPGATARLMAALEHDPSTAVVGPRIVDPRGEVTAAAGGAEPTLRSVLGHFLMLSRVPLIGRLFSPFHLRHSDRAAEPDWTSGAAMMVRRTPFEAVGGFDGRMFMYMEDVDLCRRLREAGWRIRYEPEAVVEHEIGGSQTDQQPATWYRAFDRYVIEHRGRAEARAIALVATAGMLGRAALHWRSRATNARRMLLAGRAAALAVRSSRTDA